VFFFFWVHFRLADFAVVALLLMCFQEYIYVTELEKASLASKIKFLKNQVSQLRVDLGVPESVSAGNSAELHMDEEGELKAGSQDKLIECLYVDSGAKKTCKIEKSSSMSARFCSHFQLFKQQPNMPMSSC
jgi:hypothetical protein